MSTEGGVRSTEGGTQHTEGGYTQHRGGGGGVYSAQGGVYSAQRAEPRLFQLSEQPRLFQFYRGMSSWARQAISRVLSRLSVMEDGRGWSVDVLESCVLTLELVYREFLAESLMSGLEDYQEEAVQLILTALQTLIALKNQAEATQTNNSPPVIRSRTVGRPRYAISRDQLQFLVENHFTVPQISHILGISSRTVERRLSENRISIQASYANLTDAELNRLVEDIQSEYPSCGNRQMKGHLLSRGFRVQQHRIREAQRTIDPEGSIMRRLRVINRRNYSVPGPRSLWHIDGNHKLIKCVT